MKLTASPKFRDLETAACALGFEVIAIGYSSDHEVRSIKFAIRDDKVVARARAFDRLLCGATVPLTCMTHEIHFVPPAKAPRS